MDKAEQPTITLADELLREIFLHGHSEGWTGNQTRRDVQHVDAEKGWSLYASNGALEKTKARHRTTSLAAQDDVTLVEELRAEISNLEAALTQIAGSHWERYGIGQTDIEDVPDLSAEEAMNVARDALSNTPAPSPPAQDGLVEALEAMLRAVCGETGFANAVRGTTGKAYPWPALDMAEEKAQAALSAIKEQHHD